MDDIWLPIATALVFFLAGGVKGVIGLGLPTVSLGLLTAITDLTTAMALMVVPSFVTNLWQGLVGGHLWTLLRRLWPFLLPAAGMIFVGAQALSLVDLGLLSMLLGALLIAYAGLALTGFRLSLTPRQERWAGPSFGFVNGILTGLTGSFVVPGVMFLQAIGLSRDALIQAMGIAFTLSTFPLALALHSQNLWTSESAGLSAAAVIPAVLGMLIGQRVRARLSEARFRRVFFWSILVLGAYIVLRGTL